MDNNRNKNRSRYTIDNQNSRPRQASPRQQRDGVIYEPSREASRGTSSSAGTPPPLRRKPTTPPPRKNPQSTPKSQFAIFYIATVVVGMLVCLVVAAIAFNAVSGGRQGPVADASPTPGVMASEPAILEMNQVTGVIIGVTSGSQSLQVQDVTNDKAYTLAVDNSTTLKDKYGNPMTFAEFFIGEVVDASFDAKSNQLVTLSVSGQAWNNKTIKGVFVNPETKTVTYGNDIYTYNDSLACVYNGAPYAVANIDVSDIVTMAGLHDKLWYIEVVKSHGFINITNKDKIKDGALEVDTSIFMPLADATQIKVLEGPHKVVVKGANIEPFSRDITVLAGQSATLDLTEVQVKAGTLSVSVSEPDYTLYIDDKETAADEPIVLDYGQYNVKVQKEGFTPWENTVKIDQPSQSVQVTLVKEVLLGKLVVSTSPAGADVYIDNAYIGVSPVSASVEYGQHTISVRKDGYISISYGVDVNAKEAPYQFDLQAAPVTAAPNSGGTDTGIPSAPNTQPANGLPLDE